MGDLTPTTPRPNVRAMPQPETDDALLAAEREVEALAVEIETLNALWRTPDFGRLDAAVRNVPSQA